MTTCLRWILEYMRSRVIVGFWKVVWPCSAAKCNAKINRRLQKAKHSRKKIRGRKSGQAMTRPPLQPWDLVQNRPLWCLCTAQRTRSGECYWWTGLHLQQNSVEINGKPVGESFRPGTHTSTDAQHENIVSTAELSMGWVDTSIGLGQDFSVFGGLGWTHYSKSNNNSKGIC